MTDPGVCLPQELSIGSIDDILYRIGLCLISVGSQIKRKFFRKPWIVLSIVSVFMSTKLITISLSETNDIIFRAMGDTGYLIGVRQHLGMVFIMISILSLTSQLIYYQNYRNGVEPTFLRVFQVMSGRIPPKTIGLTNGHQIRQLLRITRKMHYYLKLNNDVFLPLTCPLIIPCYYLFYANPFEAIVYGVPHGLLFAFWCHTVWNVIGFQFICFHTICLYLKIKLNNLNQNLIDIKLKKKFINIRKTIQSLHSVYNEINQYNNSFWSKFLAAFWLTFGLMDVIILYITLFCPIALPILLAFIYSLVIFSAVFLFLIFTASSVNYTANKSYETINSLYVEYLILINSRSLSRIHTKLRVSSTYLLNYLGDYFLFRFYLFWKDLLRGRLDFLVGSYSLSTIFDVMKQVHFYHYYYENF